MLRIWMLVLLFAAPILLKAQPPNTDSAALRIYGFHNQLLIKQAAGFFMDSSKQLSPAQIQKHSFSASYSQFVQGLYNHTSSANFWIKFSLQNVAHKALPLYLYCGDLNYLDLYIVSPGRPMQKISGGTLRSNTTASFAEEEFTALPLTLPAGESATLYIKITQQTQEFSFAGIELWSEDALTAFVARNYSDNRYFIIFQLLFQGFLLCQMLYTFFQWYMVRRREYLYYSLYILVIALYFLSKYELLYGADFLFARYPLLKVYFSKTLLILPYFLYFRFIRSFLEIPAKYPALNQWIVWLERFLLVYLVFDLLLIVLTFDQPMQTGIFTFVLLGVFMLATSFIVYMFRQRQTLVYYVLTGSLFVALGNITGMVLTYLEDNLHLVFQFQNALAFSQVGILLEIICFTAGLSYKSRAAEREKIASQQKLIEQLTENEALHTKIEGIRNEIARDLHDDIGSTLSSISILSELAVRENSREDAKLMLNEIQHGAQSLMEKMDDIVWSIGMRNDSMENLLMRLKQFASLLFEAKNIDYTIFIQENIAAIRLPMDYRRHIYLMVKETINNLAKYSNATKATLEVLYEHSLLVIRVSDNGGGFNAQRVHNGNGLMNIKKRAELMSAEVHINSSPGAGTTLQLNVKIK